ncbi:MAG: von Willebrand factor type A domain-containing protein [Bacteroidetes bacterium]|nr:von Willebrand factor type A domain-containing protein [Bacteroidota bacterium]
MKSALLLLLAVLSFLSSREQFYLRGEVRDEKNSFLPDVKILLHSSGYLYHSGSSGAFGIPVPQPSDTLTLSAEGYQTITVRVDASQYQNILLHSMFHPAPPPPKKRLLSLTKDWRNMDRKGWTVGAETYSSLVENDFIPATRFPETGFAVTIDKASYSNVRRFLNMGSTIPPDAVRIEELLNYFNFGYVDPPADSCFGMHSKLSICPWNANHQLLFLQVCARKIDAARIPPANLVFLVDVSGSMDLPNKLPLLKSAFKLLVNNLRPVDTVTIVTYGSSVAVALQPSSGQERKKILQAIEDLQPGGATPGEAGIRAAYRLAKSQLIPGGNNRVILATDGDFNEGETSEEELEKLVSQYKDWGVYLTCLGVGMGNYKDSKLEALAKKGNGNFAYLDDAREAEKVLVREFTQTVYAVADDAYLNISFNPGLVRNYRLIGFDNKVKVLSDSLSEIQGGEVGSGHSLLALFEVVPVNADSVSGNADRLARVVLNYKLPNERVARSSYYECSSQVVSFQQLQPCYRFASSIAMFGGLLKKSPFMRQADWKDAYDMASRSSDPADGMQQEFIGLIEKARKIYGRNKHRRVEE